MAQFGPESVAHFAPEWVAYFGSEWVAQFGPEYADHGLFLYVTAGETKNGFLLIEVFRNLFNPQNDIHQGSILGGHFLIYQSF